MIIINAWYEKLNVFVMKELGEKLENKI